MTHYCRTLGQRPFASVLTLLSRTVRHTLMYLLAENFCLDIKKIEGYFETLTIVHLGEQ